ncbi:hypothetical protein Fleli_3232 [Bernardetia litoralis DSM 6794]|uniref:Uncharacterized protein n=1 Tax=Bernardetia litoralis (strain ATCC 23117 / DSM 6794 / NBRC 15988 / NCIMB 1366 / Fx l1 / Sio-4) TaxID=880071 RepID=I4ANM8_BERLS|nr:hypothetical protein [Bernardetia litoralis]AFM05563.1 hypothetical protein Fleli_3232 [Bernardetia litoralis DSM 6794]
MKGLKLIEELNAEDNSFLIQLRSNLHWNHNSFMNLIDKLYKECQRTEKDTVLDREIACGIWYISTFIKDWSTDENFPQKFSEEYYENAYELIDDLVYHYFMAKSLYIYKSIIEDKIKEMKLFFK